MVGTESWVRRQHTLADFGVLALATSDLGAVLEHGCRLVARGLNCPIAKALKWMPDEEDLILCAAVGVPRSVGVPGTTRIPGGRESAAGYTVASGKPVISDVTKETRFVPGEVVRRAQVRHSVNVLVPCGDEVYGVLEADRKDDPPFTAEDVDFLQTFGSLIGAAVLRQRDAERIAGLLREKELLLRELQHRVKNDLQIIVSVVELQQRRAANPDIREQLAAVSGRIDSLRLVHEHLYRSQGLDRFDLGDYLRTLATDRFRMHGLDPAGPVQLHTDVVSLVVDRDLAMPLGLIANEFITNSFKYAFGGGPGIVRLTLARVSEHQARLTVEDNGRGMPAPATVEKGTGLRLIDLLARQIRAEATWSSEHGTRLELGFDVPSSTAPQD